MANLVQRFFKEQMQIEENIRGFEISRCQEHQLYPDHDFRKAVAIFDVFNCCSFKKALEKRNTVTKLLINQIRNNQISASPAATEHMKIDYLAIGANYTTPVNTDTLLGNELFRAAPDTLISNGDNTVVAFNYIDVSTGNGASTTVAAGTWTTTSFDVDDDTDFTAGDRIRVAIGAGYEFRTIDTVSSGTITVTTAFSSAPLATATCIQAWGEGGLFAGAATGTADTGTLLNRSLLEYGKDSSKELVVESQLIYTGI